MSQNFYLKLATDTLIADAQQLNVTPELLLQIGIEVQASICQQPEPMLCLSYHITLPDTLATRLEWQVWSPDNVTFTDYLWQQTCLECFIATDSASYIEVNASPSGTYALYTFSDYRTPASLPPTPLMINNSDRAYIRWLTPTTKSTQTFPHYQRRFGIPLAQLPNEAPTATHPAALIHHCVHPCVILKIDETLLYFAPMHAAPPDFHNRALWSNFKT